MAKAKDASLTNERWLPVVGYESNYEVSDRGSVRSIRVGRGTFVGKIIKPRITDAGYLDIGLCLHSVHHRMTVHRIVMAAFVGPRPSCKEVNHKDGIKSNCSLCNLEYVTPSENQIHAFRTGLRSHKGEKNVLAKLTEEDVFYIRGRIGKETQTSIAAQFNVCKATIGHIATGRNWGWL